LARNLVVVGGVGASVDRRGGAGHLVQSGKIHVPIRVSTVEALARAKERIGCGLAQVGAAVVIAARVVELQVGWVVIGQT
jgi:hypothetical protein